MQALVPSGYAIGSSVRSKLADPLLNIGVHPG